MALATASAASGEPPRADFVFEEGALTEGRRLTRTLREGHTTLEWKADVGGDIVFDVESALGGDFSRAEERYEGADRLGFISGLETGEHAFRVRARRADAEEWGPWSEEVIIPVKHQSLALAWSLFGVGLVLFGCIVVFVLSHARGGDGGGAKGGVSGG